MEVFQAENCIKYNMCAQTFNNKKVLDQHKRSRHRSSKLRCTNYKCAVNQDVCNIRYLISYNSINLKNRDECNIRYIILILSS